MTFLPRLFASAFLVLASLPAIAQSVAVTFDDGPSLAATPRLTAAERNGALLAALARHRVQAALFVTANNAAVRPEGLPLARAWGAAGHALGNHTMSHPDLDSPKVTLAQYQADVFADPVYRLMPDRAAPGQSVLLSMARSRGLGRFEGWHRLVDDGDFEIDALQPQGL
ncbi:polysaccharide deacetylase family protein [Massilia niabensis]|uniref:Polysaccharide deacetylase family protein n=1 Tax=Massilia niabensis TaxID=544910 RepID=A0ABW0LB08_9BURK